jgi:hypothetical protein
MEEGFKHAEAHCSTPHCKSFKQIGQPCTAETVSVRMTITHLRLATFDASAGRQPLRHGSSSSGSALFASTPVHRHPDLRPSDPDAMPSCRKKPWRCPYLIYPYGDRLLSTTALSSVKHQILQAMLSRLSALKNLMQPEAGHHAKSRPSKCSLAATCAEQARPVLSFTDCR